MPNINRLQNLLNQLLPQPQSWRRYLAPLILICLLTVGCTQKADSKFDINITVKPAYRSGIYQVTGSTNLPEGTLLSIAAIRSFRYPEAKVTNANTLDSYAILARQLAKVEQGTWEVNLNLWQVAPDGQYQESWQQDSLNTGVPIIPSSQVTFVALLDPANQIPELRKALEDQRAKLSTSSLRYTTDGQWYLRASQNLAVSLPIGKTTPPVLSAKDINGGWGDRSLINPENNSDTILPPATVSQTDAPLSPAQFMR